MNGRKPRTPRSEKASGLAWRSTAASHGMASWDTCEPSSLMDWPVQSLMKSGCDQRAPLGLRIVGLRGPDACRQGARGPPGAVGGAEVVQQPLGPPFESIDVLLRQARANEAESGHELRQIDLARGLTEGDGRDRPAVCGVLSLVEEEPRRAAVELLRHRPHLAGADDADQAGRLENLQVMADGSLRHLQLFGDLLRGAGPVTQQLDELRAEGIGHCPQLLRLGDEHRVLGFV